MTKKKQKHFPRQRQRQPGRERKMKPQLRVNAVAPGPIWTPLIPSTFPEDHVESFGAKVPMNRAGQPDECAPAYVFLASHDSSYMTGQVLHPNAAK
jgi:NAD(P)-dependent dehydrogenase (short-subunit alcohol dehydrogenase family)